MRDLALPLIVPFYDHIIITTTTLIIAAFLLHLTTTGKIILNNICIIKQRISNSDDVIDTKISFQKTLFHTHLISFDIHKYTKTIFNIK